MRLVTPWGSYKEELAHHRQKPFSAVDMGACGLSRQAAAPDGVTIATHSEYESIAKKRKESLAFRRYSGLSDLLKIKTAVAEANEVHVYKINLLGLTNLGNSEHYGEETGQGQFRLQKSPLKSLQARLLKWSSIPKMAVLKAISIVINSMKTNSIRLFSKFKIDSFLKFGQIRGAHWSLGLQWIPNG